MRRRSLHIRQLGFPITALLLLASAVVQGQSLGDVARENREKQAEATASAPRKVITDADLAKDGEEPGELAGKALNPGPRKIGTGGATSTSPVDPRVAEQWRKQILAQKRTVATLEKRVARFQTALSYGDAGAISRGEILTRNQALEQERLSRAQEELSEQKARLVEMQDEARRAGMYPKVYDP